MPYGSQVKFGVARQTAAGSGNAATAAGSFHQVPLTSENIGLDKAEVISANLIGRFEQGAVYDGVNRVNGTIEYEPTPKALGILLTLGFGIPTRVASNAMYNLTYFPRTADYSATIIQEPATVYKQFTDSTSAEYFFDCQISQSEFTFAQGQLLKARATLGGGTRAATGIGSLALPLDGTDLGLGFTWDTTSISYGGAALTAASDITVSVNDNIDPVYTLNGTLAPYKYTRTGFREVTVNGTMYFDTRSSFNDFMAGTQRQLLINAIAKRTTIASGYYATFNIDVPQLKLTKWDVGASGPGEVAAKFTGRGILDPNSNYAIKIFLLNTYANSY